MNKDNILPDGYYHREEDGIVIIYKVVGSCLGDMECRVGSGKNIQKAIESGKKNGLWPNE